MPICAVALHFQGGGAYSSKCAVIMLISGHVTFNQSDQCIEKCALLNSVLHT